MEFPVVEKPENRSPVIEVRRVSSPKQPARVSPDRRESTVGILRLDIGKPRRSSGGSVEFRGFRDRLLSPQAEPSSPQPSVDRLSVTFAAGEEAVFIPGSPPSSAMDKVRFSREPTVTDGEEDEDYSASVSAIMQRRASARRHSRRRRRPSSPFSPPPGDQDSAHSTSNVQQQQRRRSSVFTTSSGETAISVDEEMTHEQIVENLRLHKEVLSSVKQQPWGMRRKLRLVQQAKAYVKQHEGELRERLAQSRTTKDMLSRFNLLLVKRLQYFRRELANLINVLVPWELRIKEIESHFGSVVASYFTFLRWLFWVNLVISVLLVAFVAIPEMLTADASGERKVMLPTERRKATNLDTLWDFDGVLKYSPIFYGYYTNRDAADKGYRLPFAYFMTGVAVYVYSFVATLRKMAENSRMSKLSEKDDECVFTWKLFTGWDYMIGNAETATNRVASIILGFKEALLEEAERQRDARNWRVILQRLFVNVAVLLLLVSSAYAVVEVVKRSTQTSPGDSWWRQNEITVVLSLISFVFPILFELLGLLECYHPRKQLRIQLARIMVLNMLNLYTLIIALFGKINDMTEDLESWRPNSTSTTTVAPPRVTAGPCRTVEVACLTLLLASSAAPRAPPPPRALVAASTASPTPEYNDTTDGGYWTDIDNVTYSDPSFPTDNYSSLFSLTVTSPSDVTSTLEDTYGYENFTSSTLFNFSYYESDLDNITATESSQFEFTSTDTSTGFWETTSETSTVESKMCYKYVCPPSVATENSTNTRECKGTAELSQEEELKQMKLRDLCWETMFGQELVKLTIMDLILTIVSTLLIDFVRALLVRGLNSFWCWDLEKQFPQYGDFKIAENILHLVYNQGMVWMGMFFSPGLPLINLLKLVIIMYLRSWTVLTCNVPHEVVFRASRSNNFYLALLLTMLFLCVLPVGYAIVWVAPSWHCGPFSNYPRIYHLVTQSLRNNLPTTLHRPLDYIASPCTVIPLLGLLTLIIYYLLSLTSALREANNDLKIQLRRERTEERRKMFQLADGRRDATPYARWRRLLPAGRLADVAAAEKQQQGNGSVKADPTRNELLAKLMKRALRKSSATSDDESTVVEATAPLPAIPCARHDSLASSGWSDVIPEIRISETVEPQRAEPQQQVASVHDVTRKQVVRSLAHEGRRSLRGHNDATHMQESRSPNYMNQDEESEMKSSSCL